jgi:glycosyltransferase involved in cell wall biosynthesis
LLPLYVLLKKLLRKRVHYVVVGGWLPDTLRRYGFLRNASAKLDGIHVETAGMKERLAALGLSNVHVMPNFRRIAEPVAAPRPPGSPLKLVFFSRVYPDKGVEDAIAAVRRANSHGTAIQLDIYGPIRESYRERFAAYLREMDPNESYARYTGFLEPDRIATTLNRYDLLVFPTRHSGEGFPGAIIDAYACGLPVVASDWRYNNEVVTEGETGLLFANGDIDDLSEKLQRLARDPDWVMSMKRRALAYAGKFSADIVVGEFLRRITP